MSNFEFLNKIFPILSKLGTAEDCIGKNAFTKSPDSRA